MVTLVTGVPGWLGNRLLSLLAGKGEDIRCLVNERVDTSPIKDSANEIVLGDVRTPQTLRTALRDVDTVFHLAAVLHSRRARFFYDINAKGTENLLEQAMKEGIRRFIHVSSDSVAGYSPANGALLTEADPPRPATPYGKSKRLAEEHVARAHEQHGLKTTIVRPCWIYGPGQPPRMAQFMHLVASGRFPLSAGGRNRVSMSYVDDVARALLLASRSRKAVGRTYFIADEEPYTLLRVYKAVAAAMDMPFSPLNVPGIASQLSWGFNQFTNTLGLDIAEFRLLGDFSWNMAYSIESAKQELGFRPTMALERGMKMAAEWSRARGEL